MLLFRSTMPLSRQQLKLPRESRHFRTACSALCVSDSLNSGVLSHHPVMERIYPRMPSAPLHGIGTLDGDLDAQLGSVLPQETTGSPP